MAAKKRRGREQEHTRVAGGDGVAGRGTWVRVPWTDPSVIYPEHLDLPEGGFDLNGAFRAHLVSPSYRARARKEAAARIKDAETRSSLEGNDLWSYYRDQRLLSALAAFDAKKGKPHRAVLEDFAHTLATSDAWYFSHASARPQTHGPNFEFARADALGFIGTAFEEWLEASNTWSALAKVGNLTLSLREVGELPFAERLVRLCRKRAPKVCIRVLCAATIDARIRSAFDKVLAPLLETRVPYLSSSLDAKAIPKAAALLKGKPGLSLRAAWRPVDAAADFASFGTFVTACAKHGVPLSLDVAATSTELVAHSLAFRALDFLKEHEAAFARVSIQVHTKPSDAKETPFQGWVKDQARASLFQIQLNAEFEPKETRKLLGEKTRVETRPSREARSHYDLAEIYNRFGRFCGEAPHMFSHLAQLEKVGGMKRSDKPARYILFPGSATIVPVGESTELYVAAIAHFEKACTTLSYLDRFDEGDRAHAFRLVERLLTVQVLRFA